MNDQRLPPPPTWEHQSSAYPDLPEVPKLAPDVAWVAFENAAAETAARIRSGLSLPSSNSSPDAKGIKGIPGRSRRRYGSEPPPSPVRWPSFSPRPWRSGALGGLPGSLPPVLSGRLAGLELPQPPLPPVAGELRLRLEALEYRESRESREARKGSLALELERTRSAYIVIQGELEQKSEEQGLLQREITGLRADLEKVSEEKESLQQALHLLEESKAEVATQVAQAEQGRGRLEEESRRLSELLKASERKERHLERAQSQSKELMEQKDWQLQKLQADLRGLREALQERERAEKGRERELREAQNRNKVVVQKQREIDQLAEDNRLLRVALEEFEEERARVLALERSLQQSQEDCQVLRRSVEELEGQSAAHLEAQRRLQNDCRHLRSALKQREQAERNLQAALNEQHRLRLVSVEAERRQSQSIDETSEIFEPLQSLPRLPLGGFRSNGFVEADMTSRRTSKASSVLTVDMTADT